MFGMDIHLFSGRLYGLLRKAGVPGADILAAKFVREVQQHLDCGHGPEVDALVAGITERLPAWVQAGTAQYSPNINRYVIQREPMRGLCADVFGNPTVSKRAAYTLIRAAMIHPPLRHHLGLYASRKNGRLWSWRQDPPTAWGPPTRRPPRPARAA